ncbi:peptidase C13 family protein [Cooperia oncophora]
MYDDIANNTKNPHEGKIYNAPNGTNVYEGLEIDYKLTAKRLNEALLTMHRQHRFSQLVFYLESCRSGSMFKNILRSNINVLIDAKVPSLVYAITATSESQESYATYCDNHLNLPCLGAEFSVNWMEDSDETNINAETLDEQFQIAGELTVKSDVMRFGNLSISREPPKHQEVLWPSRDVELMHLRNMKQLDPNSTAVDIQIDRIEKVRLS